MKFNQYKLLQIVLLIILLFWNIGILWEVIIHYLPDSIIFFPFLKYNYSIVCHAQPEKLFSVFGYKTLVCSRCFGIYFGALISSVTILFGWNKSISIKFLLFASMPMFVDIILYGIGLYDYNKYIAFSTGFILGIIGLIFFYQTLKGYKLKN